MIDRRKWIARKIEHLTSQSGTTPFAVLNESHVKGNDRAAGTVDYLLHLKAAGNLVAATSVAGDGNPGNSRILKGKSGGVIIHSNGEWNSICRDEICSPVMTAIGKRNGDTVVKIP